MHLILSHSLADVAPVVCFLLPQMVNAENQICIGRDLQFREQIPERACTASISWNTVLHWYLRIALPLWVKKTVLVLTVRLSDSVFSHYESPSPERDSPVLGRAKISVSRVIPTPGNTLFVVSQFDGLVIELFASGNSKESALQLLCVSGLGVWGHEWPHSELRKVPAICVLTFSTAPQDSIEDRHETAAVMLFVFLAEEAVALRPDNLALDLWIPLPHRGRLFLHPGSDIFKN